MNRKKTITELKKIFNEKSNEDIKLIPESERKIYLDDSHVLGVIPKTELARKILIDNFEVTESTIPGLVYEGTQLINAKCKYSLDYLKVILEFIKMFSEEESVLLCLREQYPLKVELKQYILILAPRINNE